jgi:hypothetical protein
VKRTALVKPAHADDETPLELPAPEEIAERARGLRAASLAAISVADVTALVAAQVKKAKGGDARAAKLVLDYVAGASAPPPAAPAPRSVGRPIRLESAEPPKPIALPGAGTEQYRRLVALHLLAHQPVMVAGILRLTGLESEQVDALLNHDWFQRDGATVRLTPAGRNAVG